MPIYNHMFDVAFTIEGSNPHPNQVSFDDLIEGLEKRLRTLKAERNLEAFGYCDSYEVAQSTEQK